ncbi:hypothetical protein EMIT0P4_10094 [Pseudomonas sp. IT-P4]
MISSCGESLYYVHSRETPEPSEARSLLAYQDLLVNKRELRFTTVACIFGPPGHRPDLTSHVH